jgi:hypothetical protein
VVGWGRNDLGQTTPPTFAAPVTQIAAGFSHGLVRLADGTVRGWGRNDFGQATPPPGLQDVVAVDAGFEHSVALRSDGSVVAWGANTFGQARPPQNLGRVRAIAAGADHTLALLEDGRVVGWGNNQDGQLDAPPDLKDVIALDAAYHRSLALTASGQIRVWGAGAPSLQKSISGLGTLKTAVTGGFHVAVLVQPDDADRDGLDRLLEIRLGSSPESADTDGDGLDDRLEHLFGFHPTIPNEAVDATVRSGFAVRIRCFTLPSGRYQLSTSNNLLDWVPVGDPIRDRSGYSEQLLEARQNQTFYRFVRIAE